MNEESIYPINEKATEIRQLDIAANKVRMTWDCEQKLLMARHVLVLGSTGSGKTYFAIHYAFDYYPCFIFVNSSLEEEVTKLTQITCHTPEEVFDALEDGNRRIEYIPPMDREVAKEELTVIRQRLFEIGSAMNLPEGEFWVTILIDEIQDYAEKRKESEVNNFFRRGRHNRVRVWGMTLQGQDISTTVLTQTEYQVIFISNNWQIDYYNHHHMPYESWLPWLRKEYHYVLINQKQEVSFCTPISDKRKKGLKKNPLKHPQYPGARKW